MTDEFERPEDKAYREAKESGAFDDLPGKGKPFQWDDESMVPEDLRMVHRLLKNNGFTLDWIEMAREMDREHEGLRATLEAARAERAAGRLDAAGWRKAAGEYVNKVRDLNRRVIGYNLRVPSEIVQKRPYPIDPDIIDAANS